MTSVAPPRATTRKLKEPSPLRLSWGAELEFLVAYCWSDENCPIPDDGLPAALPIPRLEEHEGLTEKDHDSHARGYVYPKIIELLKDNAFPTVPTELDSSSRTVERLKYWRTWEVGFDTSVMEESEELELRWCPVELISPAEWDTSEAYQVLRHAVSILTSNFRIITNDSCGLHIHVGRAEEWMPLNYLQRMGGLFWASGRILSALNPPWRTYSDICPDIREQSSLARATNPSREYDTEVNNYVGTHIRHGERSTFWRETHAAVETMDDFQETRVEGNFEPYLEDHASSSLHHQRSALDAMTYRHTNDEDSRENEEMKEHLQVHLGDYTFVVDPAETGTAAVSASAPSNAAEQPAIPIPSPFASQEMIWRRVAPLESVPSNMHQRKRLSSMPRLKKPEWQPEDERKFTDILKAARRSVPLDRQTSDVGVWEGVREIFATTACFEVAYLLRCEYRANFNIDAYDSDDMSSPDSPFIKRTIEWRQGEGSMDAEWVSTWAQIVVGLSSWAVRASGSEYLGVIANCAAFERGEPYDVIDLLEDMGLVAESIVAAKRIQNRMAAWGLEFATENPPRRSGPAER